MRALRTIAGDFALFFGVIIAVKLFDSFVIHWTTFTSAALIDAFVISLIVAVGRWLVFGKRA
ncbi:hypothetical protein IAG41_04775 [Sphingomonas sp. JC676]|uniref:hypothetical protein n=1 Tax=Sphingomonas sp. JC676 TaxID=2768065 RepID=UPI001657E673|nr:hypothetical protein [Sphingomonas sp. JC676]MBC9031699.1 hypothetical protein [Sphingomonas sp. JC676]